MSENAKYKTSKICESIFGGSPHRNGKRWSEFFWLVG
jgi:hypothetical protein